jgi:hypothetical protein
MTKSTIAGCALAIAFIRCEAVEVEKTLCSTDSVILFNCETAKNKVISLCAVKSFKRATVEYRYGTPRKIDFSYISSFDSRKKFYHGKFQGGSVATDLVWFRSGPFTYSLFSPDTGADGVAVIKSEKLISSQYCVRKSRTGLKINDILIEQATEDQAVDILQKILN